MDNVQPSVPPSYQPAPAPAGMFGTKIPSAVTFAVGVLLFLMPFADIKCNNMSLKTVSGVELATGFELKKGGGGSSLFDDMKTGDTDSKDKSGSTEKKDPNLYAMVALGLGVLGLLLSFTNAKAAIGGAMVTGIGSSAALIGMMLDIKKQMKTGMSSGGNDKSSGGLEDFGKELTDKINITVDFTPWFYVAVVAFLAAAFFSYKRMSAMKG